MPTMHLIGVNFPRWRYKGEAVFADRIYTNDGDWLRTESGARIELTDELAQSGPHGYGDFVVVKASADGMMTDDVSLVAGAVFQTEAAPIPHALDVTRVSADPQGGRAPDQPASGDPADPMATKPDGADPIAAMYEKQVADGVGADGKPSEDKAEG